MRILFPVKSNHQARRGRRSLHADSEAGFTLIEALVSALMVTLIGAAVAQALITGNNFSANQRLRSQADMVLQQDQERLKGLSDEQLAGLAQTRTTTLSGRTFTIDSKGTFIDASGGTSCDSKVAAYFRLDTTVSWVQPGSGTHSVSAGTILTRPAAGSLLVQVIDEKGPTSWLPGVTVTAKGMTTGSQQSAITDRNGCVVFSGLPGLPVQSYLVTATLGSYVDYDGEDYWPNVTANVNGTGIATPSRNPLILGNAGQLQASFVTYKSTGLSSPVSAPELSYYGQKSGQMTSFDTVTTGGTTILTPLKLFPFATPGSPPDSTKNYQVWAGGCQQQQPASPPSAASPTGQANFGTVQPGTVGTLPSNQVTVFEPAIDLAVTYNGGAVTPAHVKFIYTAASGTTVPKCWNNSYSETVSVSSVGIDTDSSGTRYGIYPGPFASDSATGQPDAAINGYQSQVQVCADYLAGSTYRKATTAASYDNSNFTAPSQWLKINLSSSSASGQC